MKEGREFCAMVRFKYFVQQLTLLSYICHFQPEYLGCLFNTQYFKGCHFFYFRQLKKICYNTSYISTFKGLIDCGLNLAALKCMYIVYIVVTLHNGCIVMSTR